MRSLTKRQQETCKRFGIDPMTVSFDHPFNVSDKAGQVWYIWCDGNASPAGSVAPEEEKDGDGDH